MDLYKGNTQVAILAFTAGLLAMWSENSQCQAQGIEPILPVIDLAPPIDFGQSARRLTTVPANGRFPNGQPVLQLPGKNNRDSNYPLAESTVEGMGVDTIVPASAIEVVNASNEARAQLPARKSYLPEQKTISEISIDVNSKAKAGSSLRPETVVGSATEELPAVNGATAAEMNLGWMATTQRSSEHFGYMPLYFEEVNLERYGRTAGFWQPAISTTRFFGTVPLLPYKLANHSPHRVYYWQWPYAAGAEAPRVRETFPLQRKAALVEAGILTGGAFLIP